VKHFTHTSRLGQMLGLLALTAAFAAPAAATAADGQGSTSTDALSRYLTNRPSTGDAVDRYLSTQHQTTNVLAAQPVSDVMNSLQVARGTRVAGEAPISDTANSLMVARSARTAAEQSTPSSAALASDYSSFNWSDATIGAAATLGFVLLAAAAALVNIRRRPVREETHV
jgi:hypothetical protein